MLLIFIFIGVVAGVPCGNAIVCQCYLNLGILQCKGGNVSSTFTMSYCGSFKYMYDMMYMWTVSVP